MGPASRVEPAPIYPMLVISPHLDDAVFACGCLLASVPGTEVVTVFAGAPHRGAPLTEWDRASGFRPGDDVMGARRAEDRRALGILGSRPRWLEFRDRQYGALTNPAMVAERLEAVLEQGGPRPVLFPLGLFHSDHRIVREAVLLLLGRHPSRPWFAYADALYRRIRGLVDEALADLARLDLAPREIRFACHPDARARKERALACYASQLRALATPGRPGHEGLADGERYWRVGAPLMEAL